MLLSWWVVQLTRMAAVWVQYCLGELVLFFFVFLQELSFNLRFLVGGFFNSFARLDGCNGTILLGSTTLSEAVIL